MDVEGRKRIIADPRATGSDTTDAGKLLQLFGLIQRKLNDSSVLSNAKFLSARVVGYRELRVQHTS